MKLEFLVKDKEMVKMLMLNEVEYFYNSHLFDLLKKEALMDGDNKTSNMFYKYVSNAKDIVNGSIVEKIDGSLSKIYLGLNDNSQRHGFKIEPCELSLGEKRNVILKYVYKKSNKKLLTDGVNNIPSQVSIFVMSPVGMKKMLTLSKKRMMKRLLNYLTYITGMKRKGYLLTL